MNVVYKYACGDETVLGTNILLEEPKTNHFVLTITQEAFDNFREVELIKSGCRIIEKTENIEDCEVVNGMKTKTTKIEFVYEHGINHNGDYNQWYKIVY